MDIKYHSQFLLDKEKDNPTAKLRFRIKWEGNIVAFNIGYRIEINKWSTETQRCKSNTTHRNKKVAASIINRKIQQYESACEKVFQKFELEELIPNQNQFRDFFNAEIGKTPKVEVKMEKTFFEVFDEFTKEESKMNQWTSSTEAKMQTLRNHLKRLQSKFDL